MLTEERIQQIWDKASGYIPGCERHIAYGRAIEAEVRAEAQEPVAKVTVHYNYGPDHKASVEWLTDCRFAPDTLLYAAPQSPAPCPQCAANTIFARDHYAALAEVNRLESERDALQAKVAEQSAEIERLTKERNEAVCRKAKIETVAAGQIQGRDATIGQLAERIAALEAGNKAAWATSDRHLAERSEARERIAELEQQCSNLEGERDDAEYQPWPEWSESILKIIRKRSGYDGFDDADGIDLPEELRELLAGNDAEFDREHAKLVTSNERLAEQAALIEKLGDLLRRGTYEAIDEARKAVAAQKGGVK